ncbi:MAG: class I tRNA ligase family protein [Nitrososphaeria archaeon]|nr:class I tRNA ligase family protein [Nitrososphaeria archaeon]
MYLYTTNYRELTEIIPRSKITFNIQVCGPTVYDELHLGHLKTFFFFDVLVRFLRNLNYNVKFCLNFTDIDENVFEKANKEGCPFNVLADKIAKNTINILEKLNINTPNFLPRSSNYIKEYILQIKKLLSQGLAYNVNGNIFFEFNKMYDRGPVSGFDKSTLYDLRFDSYIGKKAPIDFLLWFKCNSEPNWDSPWGLGRPGWHLQDVVIAHEIFKGPHDIHGGAIELVYPHHDFIETLGAAIEGIKPYVPYWVHTCILTINGKKMSKSLGNIVYVNEVLKRFSPETIRIYFLSYPWDEPTEFSMDQLEVFEDIIKDIKYRIDNLSLSYSSPLDYLIEMKKQFFRHLFNGMCTSKAVELFISLVKECLKHHTNPSFLDDVLTVLGLERLKS